MKKIEFKLFDAAGFASIGATLAYSATSSGSYTAVAGVDSIPAIGGTPEQIDVTTLADTSRVNVDGVKAQDQLTFSVIDQGSNITTLKGIEGVNKYWKVTFPSGHTYAFQAVAAVNAQEVAVNGALKWNLVLTVSSALTFTGVTSGD
jgi:hypothetical protein